MEHITERQRNFLDDLTAAKGMTVKDVETAIGMNIESVEMLDVSNVLSDIQKSKDKAEAIEKLKMRVLHHPDVPTEIMEQGIKAPPKHPFTTDKVDNRVELMASLHNIPAEIANMFFMIIDGKLYPLNAGLLWIAGRIGYAKILVTSHYDADKDEWQATAQVFPRIPLEALKVIAEMPPDLQKQILLEQYGPTYGYGSASKENVKNTKMYPFFKQLAETRAVDRALRLYTAYGGTAFEELPEGVIQDVDSKDNE